jgi:hypothetical protein
VAATIRVNIVGDASRAVRSFQATSRAADALAARVTILERQLSRINGRSAKVSLDAKGFVQATAAIVVANLTLDRLRKGLPDLSFGLTGLTEKLAAATAGALALTAAAVPLTGAAVGLGGALGAAGLGLGLFAAAAAPTFISVTKAVKEYNTASHAFDRAQSINDAKAMNTAQNAMVSSLAVLTPAQRKSADTLLAMSLAWQRISESTAPVVLSIMTTAASALARIIPALRPAIDAMGMALKGVSAKAFSDLAAAVPGIVKFIVGQGVPAFQTVASILSGLGPVVGHLMTAFAPLGNTILTALDTVVGRFAQFDFGPMAAVVAQLLPQLGSTLLAVIPVITGIVKAAMPLAGPVLAAVTAIGAALSAAFASPFMKTFVDNIGKIIVALTPIVVIVIGAFVRFAAVVSTSLLPLLPRLEPLVSKIADALVNVLAGLSPLLGPLLDFAGVFVDMLPNLYPVVQTLRRDVVPLLDALGGALKIIAPKLPELATQFGKILIAVAPLIVPLAKIAAALAGAMTDGLIKVLPLLTTLLTWVSNHIGLVLGFAAAISVLATAFSVLRFAMTAGLIFTAARAVLALVVACTTLGPAATAGVGALDAMLAVGGGLSVFALGMGAVVIAAAALGVGIAYLAARTQFFEIIGHGIAVGFDWVRHNIAATAVSMWAAFTGSAAATGQYIGQVIRDITARVEAVLTFLAGIPGRLVQLGVNIVLGLWNGITSGWTNLLSGFHRLIMMLPVSVQVALGVHSPSTVFAGIGRSITLGLAGGLTAEMPAVHRALAGVSSTLTQFGSALSVDLTGPQLATAGPRAAVTHNWTVNVPPTADKAGIGREIKSAIAAADRQAGR